MRSIRSGSARIRTSSRCTSIASPDVVPGLGSKWNMPRHGPSLAETTGPGFRRAGGFAKANYRWMRLLPPGPQIARNGRDPCVFRRHADPQLADHIEDDVGGSLGGAGVAGLGARADRRYRELDRLIDRISPPGLCLRPKQLGRPVTRPAPAGPTGSGPRP